MKRHTRLIALIVVAVLASALPAGASTATLMSEKLVAGKPSAGSYANLAYTSGSIVYSKVVDETNDLVDFYRYATATSNSKKAFEADGLELGRPRISGTKVVYARTPSASAIQSDIYVRDFATKSTGVELRVTSDAAQQVNPDISGDTVVWEDNRSGNYDIYAYNLKTKLESVVCTATGDQTTPSVSGSRVVYADYRDAASGWDIYVKDLKTGQEKRLTTSGGNQINPVISGDHVVYETVTGTSSAIRYLKLGKDATGKVTASPSKGLTVGVANQYAPDVSGNKVVWIYESGSTSALYVYDLAVGTRHKLFSTSSLIDPPQISGSKIAYVKTDAKGASRIYLATLKTPKLTLTAPSKVKSGAKTTVSGKLTTSAGVAIAKRSVRIEKSTDKKTWTLVKTATTSRTGAFSYKTPAIKKTTYYRATYRGGATYLSARSAVRTVGLK